ncbi:MAG: ACT domain-containing protein, partial [Geminicoccaceae bacterium]
RLKPYMRLADQLGSFAGQLTETGLESVTISYCGHVAGLNTKPLTQIILKGLLAPLMASVNMVNAPAVARSRNIGVTTSQCADVEAYQTLVCVTVETERGSRDLHGTLVHGADPRIVRMRGIDIEASLGAHMLYVRNNDQPGFVGGLGRVLGDAGINIATFHLGRSSAGGEAIALVEVDSNVPKDLLDKIAALPNVLQVKYLNF